MKLARTITTVMFCFSAMPWAVSAQAPVRDGRWEVTTEMDMPGMPMKMPATKTTQCITKEQAADPGQTVPKSSRGGDCKVSDYKTVGNKVTWTMACTGREAMTGTGEITYATDSYTGTMTMKTGGGEMTMKYTAKRLGDCTP